MSNPRPIPTAEQVWFDPAGRPRVYEYLFDLDRAVRQGNIPVAVTWEEVANKPSSFPPSAHVHEQSDIIGLDVSLASKQPLNNNLTEISGLATTSYGRGLLTQADATALRNISGLVIGTDVVAQAHVGSGGAAHAAVVAAGAAGFMTGADKSKIDGIAAGADVTSAQFGAWGSYVPVVSAGSGSFTSASGAGSYLKVGKIVFFRQLITITTVGTAGANVQATLPTGVVGSMICNGKYLNTGKSLAIEATGSVTGSTYSSLYDGSFPFTDGSVLSISGFYQAP